MECLVGIRGICFSFRKQQMWMCMMLVAFNKLYFIEAIAFQQNAYLYNNYAHSKYNGK